MAEIKLGNIKGADAVVESNKKTNGTWLKLNDGTMICTFKGKLEVSIYGRVIWYYPEEFTEVYYTDMKTTYTLHGSMDTFFGTPRTLANNLTQYTFRQSNATVSSGMEEGSYDFICYAIGKYN